ncbi:DUF4176 domain-containing protein [Neobacillus vireti]|uniref:DUF4176 domain-containing protein n=1 Tax=Neobacillus vireti TaxID=220686 RepID=UPI0030003697
MKEEFKQKLKALAMEKVDKIIYSLEKEKQMESGLIIKEFIKLFIEDQSILQTLYRAYKKNLALLELKSNGLDILYKKENSLHTIEFTDKQFSLDEDAYVHILSYSIEIMREVLPLGSVVELDRTYFKPDQQMTSPSKIIITGRFIAPKGYNTYFPYSGVVYPFGEMKPGSQIHFTAPLIKNIIHLGFKDEMDESFELLIKKEFIVDKNMKSIEFSVHDMKKLQKELESKQKAGEL